MTLSRQDTTEEEKPLSDRLRTQTRAVVVMTVFAAASIALSAGVLLGGGREFRALDELTQRINKLRVEVAIRDARFQASKGVVQGTGRLDDLLKIQEVIDRYALEQLRNGAAKEMTSDEVRREVCERLGAAGYPCVP